MTDPVKKIGDAALAREVMEKYAEGVVCEDYINEEELGLESSEPEKVLCEALENAYYLSGSVGTGAVEIAEEEKLRLTGFAPEFISELAGPDGRRALRERAKWLADHLVTPWWYLPNFSLNQRAKMAEELVSYYEDAAVALSPLLEIVEDYSSLDSLNPGEHELMYWTLDVLWNIGDKGGNIDAAAGPLTQLIANNKPLRPGVQGRKQKLLNQTVSILGQLGRKAKAALPHLKRMFQERETEELPVAVAAIEEVDMLLQDLNQENPSMRLLACRALRFAGIGDPRTVPALMEKIKTDPKLQGDAIFSLYGHGERAREAIPLLAQVYHDPATNNTTRSFIVQTLFFIEGNNPEALLIFEDYVGRDVGEFAKASFMGNLGTIGRPALPILFKTLKNPDDEDLAAKIIEDIGLQVEDIPPLMAVAFSPSFSPGHYSDGYRSLTKALANIGPAAAPPLVAILEKEEGIRWELAKDVLMKMGEKARAAAPALYALARDFKKGAKKFHDPKDVEVAGGRLAKGVDIMLILPKMGRAAVPVLVAGLKENDPNMTYLCLSSLRDIGREANEAVPTVLLFLEHPNPFLRSFAITTLESIAPHDYEVLIKIIAALQDPHPDVRQSAAFFLFDLALHDANGPIYLALPHLVSLRDDPREEERVRDAARDAITAIEEKVL